MPTNREIRAHRQQAILALLTEGSPIRNQDELVKLLLEKGIPATQSSVSRDLRDLGVLRVRGQYTLDKWAPVEDVEFQRVVGFVREANSAGPNLAVIWTRPGAGRVVGRAIDEAQWPEVIGTVAGETSVFVATASFEQQKLLFKRLNHYLHQLPPALFLRSAVSGRGR